MSDESSKLTPRVGMLSMDEFLEREKKKEEYRKSWQVLGESSSGDGNSSHFYRESLERKKVDGGWIYRLFCNSNGKCRESICFVPEVRRLDD